MNIGTASRRCKGLGKRDRKVCMKKALTKGLPKRKSAKRSKRSNSKRGGRSMLPLLLIAGAAGVAWYSTKE